MVHEHDGARIVESREAAKQASHHGIIWEYVHVEINYLFNI